MVSTLRRISVRIGRWPRWCAAGICLVIALADAVHARAREPSARARTVAVVVAARPLPAGHLLARRDLGTAVLPPRYAPPGAVRDARRLIGERLAGPLAAREPITASRLVGRGLLSGLDPTLVATSVLLEGDAHPLVHPGDRVDLLATPRPDLVGVGVGGSPPAHDRSTVTVAVQRSLVLAVYAASGDAGTASSTQLVIATSRDAATRIAALRLSEIFAVLGDPP